MKWKKRCATCSLLAGLILTTPRCKQEAPPLELLRTTVFGDYPSASTLEWTPGGLLVMGDDATGALLLDTGYRILDTISIFGEGGRISKEKKADIESGFVSGNGGVLLLGSRSGPLRARSFLLNTSGGGWKEISGWTAAAFPAGLELNIEGAALTPKGAVLANRGHLGRPVNHLLFQTGDTAFRPAVLQIVGETGFAGVSGLSYSRDGDRLYFTASVEATANSFEDGAIGDPFIGWIDRISDMHDRDTIRPSRLIPLKGIDRRLARQKVESIALRPEGRNTLRMDLCADNDDGSSTLFRLRLRLHRLPPPTAP